MSDTQTAPETTAATVVKDEKNGVVRPGAGTHTGQVWAIAEALGTQFNRTPKRAEVIAKAIEGGLNPATASTQFGKWCKYWGIKIEKPVTPAKAPEGAEGGEAPAKAPKAAKGKKSGKVNLTAAAGAEALGAVSVEGGEPALPTEGEEPTANEFLAAQAQG